MNDDQSQHDDSPEATGNTPVDPFIAEARREVEHQRGLAEGYAYERNRYYSALTELSRLPDLPPAAKDILREAGL